MSKQYLVVNGDQILVDAKLIFASIREAEGDWQQVEKDINGLLEMVQGMVELAEKQE